MAFVSTPVFVVTVAAAAAVFVYSVKQSMYYFASSPQTSNAIKNLCFIIHMPKLVQSIFTTAYRPNKHSFLNAAPFSFLSVMSHTSDHTHFRIIRMRMLNEAGS